jgi:hypothetical protein
MAPPGVSIHFARLDSSSSPSARRYAERAQI